MRILFLILLLNFNCFSQQVVGLCDDENQTFTYTSPTNDDGYNVWEVDGIVYTTENLIITWDEIGTHTISLVRYGNGCPSDPINYIVDVLECNKLFYYVPNTFTPDGDGINDIFLPIFTSGYSNEEYNLLILNRWGEIVFESHDITVGWNGTFGNKIKCQDGTYTWKIWIGDKESIINRIEISGHVNLLK